MKNSNKVRNMPELALDAVDIVNAVIKHDRRILLFGPMGVGKSTLAAQIAKVLADLQRPCSCLNADPGSPAFGIPGSVSNAVWQDDNWQVSDIAALCTLDAGRFRLPLVSAVRSLAQQLPAGIALIDAPGVVRGVAGRELLHGLVEATAVDAVLALTAHERPPPLLDELRALALDVFVVCAAPEAKRPGKRVRARQRTGQWDAYLANATLHTLDSAGLNITGTPPLPAETSAWPGKQLALLRNSRTVAMGEVRHVESDVLTVTLAGEAFDADTLLVRDAVRGSDGYIETARPYAAERFDYLPPNDVIPSVDINNGPRLVGRVGSVDVALINGVFGDPLLHLRMRHQRRSMLFDLGSGERLPARIAHQLTDVFISHAHMDHISGFIWLLRSRIGDYPACRLYGPPGLAQHIAGFLQGILWDRVEQNAPRFEVNELDNDSLQCFHLQAGWTQAQFVAEKAAIDGELLAEPGFRIRGLELDHHGTPVIAYAFEADPQINIRKDRLKVRGLAPGPWLNELKQQLSSNNLTAVIQLPDGSHEDASTLADELVVITPGKKLVYATDLADTADNRQQLIRLAQHAHTFFCECAYIEADARYALMNGHLTTRACGEIATQASVTRLVPFHFSRRYLNKTEQLYEELTQHCSRVCLPRTMTLFESGVKQESVMEIDRER